MKIIATLKSRNEEKNIANAIESYHDWVDEILLADGGSEDRTVEIALQYEKVKVLPFRRYYKRDGGSFRNHEGHHLNFLFKWAEDRGADWIIHDDCDCVLSQNLHSVARGVIEQVKSDTIHVVRLYLYGDNKYFKKMSFINNEWQAGLWAWRANIKMRCKNVKRHFATVANLKEYSQFTFEHPFCILHKFAPDEETIMKKVNDYKLEAPTATHPKATYGEPEPLPEWVK